MWHDYGMRVTCSNCEAEVAPALVVSVSGDTPKTVAHLCSACVQDVLTLKIVLKRNKPGAAFEFEGYLPVETTK